MAIDPVVFPLICILRMSCRAAWLLSDFFDVNTAPPLPRELAENVPVKMHLLFVPSGIGLVGTSEIGDKLNLNDL